MESDDFADNFAKLRGVYRPRAKLGQPLGYRTIKSFVGIVGIHIGSSIASIFIQPSEALSRRATIPIEASRVL